MTGQELAALAGVVLSLAFSYIPGLNTWYNQHTPDEKRALMGVLLFVVASVVYGLSCLGVGTWFVCTPGGLWGAVQCLLAALMANQATFTISPRFTVPPSDDRPQE